MKRTARWHCRRASIPSPDLSPQRKKERTLEALLRQLEGLRVAAGVVMVFEPISPRRPPFTVQASKVWAPNGNDRPITRV
jgi:hypothetical protein